MLVPDSMDGLYHVVSRVVDRRMVFGEAEKQRFRSLLVAYSGFSGIQVVAWCLMDNHFHLLLKVPSKAGLPPSDLPEKEVLRRLGLIYGRRGVKETLRVLSTCGSPESRRKYLEQFTRRMGDLGLMMKSLKQRFSVWFNKEHGRTGTLWEDRYKSVIVEVDEEGTLGHAARIVAAYIDLNPVRAGVTGDPKDYGWCGYARAVAGEKDCERGIVSLWGESGGVAEALAKHRLFLFDTGSEEWAEKTQDNKTQDPRTGEMKTRHGINARKVWEERKRGGRLPLATVLRLKSRYLVDGGIVGSRGFVEKVTGKMGEKGVGASPGAERSVGSDGLVGAARTGQGGVKMRFAEWGGLHVLRNLRKDVVG